MTGLEWFLYALVLASGAAGVVWALRARGSILAMPAGNERMQEIAAAIQEGATAYLRRQYLTIAMVGVVILLLLTYFLGLEVGIGYAIGACLLGRGRLHRHERLGARQRPHRAGRGHQRARRRPRRRVQVGRGHRHVRGGARPAWASRSTTASCSLLGVEQRRILEALVGLSFGASLISIFARLGGGIFTKGADVGADLVGKVEAGIPEDDPRNPGRDRGQCRRQCRRLRRHGGRPVRDLCRHVRRDDAARRHLLHRCAGRAR